MILFWCCPPFFQLCPLFFPRKYDHCTYDSSGNNWKGIFMSFETPLWSFIWTGLGRLSHSSCSPSNQIKLKKKSGLFSSSEFQTLSDPSRPLLASPGDSDWLFLPTFSSLAPRHILEIIGITFKSVLWDFFRYQKKKDFCFYILSSCRFQRSTHFFCNVFEFYCLRTERVQLSFIYSFVVVRLASNHSSSLATVSSSKDESQKDFLVELSLKIYTVRNLAN